MPNRPALRCSSQRHPDASSEALQAMLRHPCPEVRQEPHRPLHCLHMDQQHPGKCCPPSPPHTTIPEITPAQGYLQFNPHPSKTPPPPRAPLGPALPDLRHGRGNSRTPAHPMPRHPLGDHSRFRRPPRHSRRLRGPSPIGLLSPSAPGPTAGVPHHCALSCSVGGCPLM